MGRKTNGDNADWTLGSNRAQIPKSKLPEHTTPEFAYLIATLAWQDGLTANAISKRVFDDSSAEHLMQVKRALKRAQNEFLVLNPPTAQKATTELDQVFNTSNSTRRINIHVVDDSDHAPGVPVYVKAAEIVSRYIMEAARAGQTKETSDKVVISNAGGRTVSKTVKALLRNPPVLEEEDTRRFKESMMFVAANAAYDPQQFQVSANFLSVTMAELFHAQHLALPIVENEKWHARHKALINQASVFICGAGACHTDAYPGLMTQFFSDRRWSIPANAVGDLAFNLLDEHGNEVQLPEEQRQFMRTVNPSLDLLTLTHIASEKRVVLILDSQDPNIKRDIGTAVLLRHYVTDVVLGTRLARPILKKMQQTPNRQRNTR